MPRLLSATLLLAAALMLSVPANTAQAQMAVRGDTVYTMAGDGPIVDGVVLIENGTIEAVGPASEVSVPDGYATREATVVTPGLVDPHATVGLSGIYNVDADQDVLDTSAPMQPALRVIDAYNPREQLVGFVRQLGITTVHTGHAPGATISGQTAVFKTHGTTIEETLVDSMTAMAMTLGPSVSQNFESPGTRAKGMAMLRSKLLAAERYAEKREADSDTPVDLEMEALAKVIGGEVPALITAHEAPEIQSALRLAREFDLDLILDGAVESYLLIDEIQAAGVPVILHPTMIRTYGPAQNAAYTTAARLHDAGIPVAIQSGYEPYVPKTRIALFEAAIAVANGLPRQAALASITRTPAEIIGLGDRVGTLEAGKDADLALFDGDPFEYTTHTCTVIIDGAVASDECK
jgi:imidazolonepropionase-like amidohydrolase